MTDAEIVAIRDKHLPSQGNEFDCIAFARDILEQAAKLCEKNAKLYGGVAVGPMSTSRGKLVHESMAAGALNCANGIRRN